MLRAACRDRPENGSRASEREFDSPSLRSGVGSIPVMQRTFNPWNRVRFPGDPLSRS